MGVSDKARYETKLVNLAADDSIAEAKGLHLLLNTVKPWAKDDVLKKVRKYRTGRHRCYVVGEHTDCHYKIVFVLPNKRDEEDQAKTAEYQRKVLRALSTGGERLIEAIQENVEDVPGEV